MLFKNILALVSFCSATAFAADPVQLVNCDTPAGEGQTSNITISSGGSLAKGTLLISLNGRPVQTNILDADATSSGGLTSTTFYVDAENFKQVTIAVDASRNVFSVVTNKLNLCQGNVRDDVDEEHILDIVQKVSQRPVLFSCTYPSARGAGATIKVTQMARNPDELVMRHNGAVWELRRVAEASRRDERYLPNGELSENGRLRYGFTFYKRDRVSGSLVLEMDNKKQAFVRLDESHQNPTRLCEYVDPDMFGIYETNLDSVVNFVSRRP